MPSWPAARLPPIVRATILPASAVAVAALLLVARRILNRSSLKRLPISSLPDAGRKWYAARLEMQAEVGPQLPEHMGWQAAIRECFGIGGRELHLLAHLADASTEPVAAEDSRDPQRTGGALWDASICLARFLEYTFERQFTAHNLQWVELGSGIGLPGMAAAVLGERYGHRVVLTDLPMLVPSIRARLEANGLDNARAVAYAWGEAPAHESIGDFVLVADCCWHLAQVPLLVRALELVTRAGSTAFIVTQRRQESVEAALRAALTPHFAVKDLPAEAYHPDYGDLGGRLCFLVAKRTDTALLLDRT